MSSFKFKSLNVALVSLAVVIIGCCSIVSCNFLYYDKQKYSGTSCTTADKKWGECQSNCTTLTKEQRLIKENTCGFDKGEPIFCCPKYLINNTVMYPILTEACLNRDEPIRRIWNAIKYGYEKNQAERFKIEPLALNALGGIQAKLRKFLNGLKKETLSQFGGRKFPIYNQTCKYFNPTATAAELHAVVSNKEFPFMSALGWRDYDNTSISWNCGGTLIHPSFVITAAHCNDEGPPDIVRIGVLDLNYGNNRLIGVDYDIVELFVHDKYNPATYYNDIALLKVKKVAEYRHKPGFPPSCLWMQREIPVSKLNLLGYGAPAFGRVKNGRLYKGNLTILPNADCAKYYEQIDQLPQGIINSQLCALDPEGKLDTCEGDSGGPLQFDGDAPYLVAVISFGKKCLDGTPGVYTRVFDFLEWIEKILRENL